MCGHDLHMSALVATAGIMARTRRDWRGQGHFRALTEEQEVFLKHIQKEGLKRTARLKPSPLLGQHSAEVLDEWGVDANAIAALVDARGRILVDALRPGPIPASVRAVLAGVEPGEPGGLPDDRTQVEEGPIDPKSAEAAGQVLARQLRPCFVPAAPHDVVQVFGEGLGEPVGQRLGHDRAVVVVLGREAVSELVRAGFDRQRPLGAAEIGQELGPRPARIALRPPAVEIGVEHVFLDVKLAPTQVADAPTANISRPRAVMRTA